MEQLISIHVDFGFSRPVSTGWTITKKKYEAKAAGGDTDNNGFDDDGRCGLLLMLLCKKFFYS